MGTTRRFVLPAGALVAVLGMALATDALAQDVTPAGFGLRNRYCPPGYVPICPESPPSTTEPMPETPSETPMTEPDSTAPPLSIAPVSEPLLAQAGGGSGAYAAMLGRLDQNNRLNLFDNMSAIPQNRAWFGFQFAEGFNTGVKVGPGFVGFGAFNLEGDILGRGNQQIYRAGVEYTIGDLTSVAVQGQYHVATDTDDPQDEFDNPEIVIKRVLRSTPDTVVSFVFGIQPQVPQDLAAIKDDTTRLYPGLLLYRQVTDRLFMQGGFQFGLPLEGNQVYTYDWAVSSGYWIYRHASLDPYCYDCTTCCGQPLVVGIIPQVELLGKHVLGDATITEPFGLSGPGIFFEEPRHVVDVTVGSQVILRNNVRLAMGVSTPLTGGEVRRVEFLSTLTYGF